MFILLPRILSSSPVSLAWGGSPLPRLKSKKFSLAPPCGRAWTPHTGLWCDHREAPWRASRSSRHLSRPRPSSTLRVSGSSFCVASGASSLCVLQFRCGQPLDSRGHHRGACAHAGVLGRRGFPLESCAARICREAGARVSSTFVSMTWISIQDREQTAAVRKWSPTVCLASTAHSLPWTPRWSAQCELTEPPGGQNGTEPPWTKPAAPKNARTRN